MWRKREREREREVCREKGGAAVEMAPKHQDLALKLVAVSGAEKPIIMRLGQDRVELRMNIKSKVRRRAHVWCLRSFSL